MNRRNFLRGGLVALTLTLGSMVCPQPANADTVYYGKINKKGEQKAAYILYDKVKVESIYHKNLPKKNDSDYNKILNQREQSISTAISEVAKAEKYEVVVEIEDPTIKGYIDITEKVVKQMKKNEGKK